MAKRTNKRANDLADVVEIEKTDEANEKATLPPNIKFIGTGQAPEIINDGSTTIVMPQASVQMSGAFYHSEAARICRLFPKKYKKFQKLGEV